ncbi:MAG: Holliday junction branch migration protein RuvA [Candidatus Peregrinibacteria bacterium]|nr:Holliday junction branch migration protein RuvA [Candidatus Peregrinibacteria bacterium]
MIAYLKGNVLKKIEKGIILDTGNVGYLVHPPAALLDSLKETQSIELFIHSNIREDAFDLYGFANYNDLTFFKTLLSVSGIGPKTGLEIMNSDIQKIKLAILNEDHGYIKKIPGIGEKTAKRMILELKSKIEMEDISALGNSSSNKSSTSSDPHPDAMEALLRLGYQRQQVSKTLRGMPTEIIEAEEVITYFLKNN